MGDRERHDHGTFSWTDLSTPDADASRDFYGALLGWDFDDAPIPEDAGGGFYRMAKIDGRSAAAMYQSSERHPAWASYVTVDDVDAVAARAAELGGTPMGEPFDVMETGRMALPGPDRRRAGAVAGGHEHRRRGRERARRAFAQPAEHEQPRGRAALLRGAARLALRARRHR